jgi:hypothetical protein
MTRKIAWMLALLGHLGAIARADWGRLRGVPTKPWQ